MTGMRDVSFALGMGATRDHLPGEPHQFSAGAVRYGNLQACVQPWCGKRAIGGNQPREGLLSNEEKLRPQASTGRVVYLEQVTRYDTLYAASQLARAMSRSSEAHTGKPRTLFGT